MTSVQRPNSDMKRPEEITLALVGDIFPANLPANAGLGVAACFAKRDAAHWSSRLAQLFAGADIVYGNLESPLIYDEGLAVAGSFAGGKTFASMLAASGIQIVSIANNHILEQGEDGFDETLRILRDNHIDITGLYAEGCSNIVVKDIRGIKLGFASFNSIHDIPNPKLYAEYSEQAVIKCITEMQNMGVDRKIISIHWGDEFIQRPSSQQIVSARKFIDAGADLVVGHHPHVVQPVEAYKNGLIFYSLGNFIFDMTWSKQVRTGLLASVKVSRQGRLDCDLKLIRLDKKDFFPSIVSDRQAAKKAEHFSTDDPARYDKSYVRDKKMALIFNRILMKKVLLMNWNKLPRDVRINIVKNFRLRR